MSNPVDTTMEQMAAHLLQNQVEALALAQKLHDLLVAEKVDWQLSLDALAMVVRGVSKNEPNTDDNRIGVRCIATGMLAANVDLGEESPLVS